MIIWNGLGILIPVIAIAGMVAGTLLAGLAGKAEWGLGLGLLLAAVANWALWKAIYPKQPRVLVDEATGRRVVMNPKHGLFFIPAKAWTWLLALLAIPMTIGGLAAAKDTAAKSKQPGYHEFTAANELIDSKRNGYNHGNSAASTQAAADFSAMMKTLADMSFTGGSKKNVMTGGEFLTYCQDGPDSIVVLCHVPSLRSYKSDEARDALATLAWTAGRSASEELDPSHAKQLLVGLRGISSYGLVLHGAVTGEPDLVEDADTSIFFPAFAASAE